MGVARQGPSLHGFRIRLAYGDPVRNDENSSCETDSLFFCRHSGRVRRPGAVDPEPTKRRASEAAVAP